MRLCGLVLHEWVAWSDWVLLLALLLLLVLGRITDQSISRIKYDFSVRVDVVGVVRVVVLAVRRLCYGVLVPCHAGSAGLG